MTFLDGGTCRGRQIAALVTPSGGTAVRIVTPLGCIGPDGHYAAHLHEHVACRILEDVIAQADPRCGAEVVGWTELERSVVGIDYLPDPTGVFIDTALRSLPIGSAYTTYPEDESRTLDREFDPITVSLNDWLIRKLKYAVLDEVFRGYANQLQTAPQSQQISPPDSSLTTCILIAGSEREVKTATEVADRLLDLDLPTAACPRWRTPSVSNSWKEVGVPAAGNDCALVIGYPTRGWGEDDWTWSQLVADVLRERLHTAFRVQAQTSYHHWVFQYNWLACGFVGICLRTNTRDASRVEPALDELVVELATQGATEAELRRAGSRIYRRLQAELGSAPGAVAYLQQRWSLIPRGNIVEQETACLRCVDVSAINSSLQTYSDTARLARLRFVPDEAFTQLGRLLGWFRFTARPTRWHGGTTAS